MTTETESHYVNNGSQSLTEPQSQPQPQSQSQSQSQTQGHFQIHYFSIASSYTGKSTESLPAPLPLPRLFLVLEDRYPGIRDKVLSSCGVSLGMDYVDVDFDEDSHSDGGGDGGDVNGRGRDCVFIRDGDEVAIIPPVSSG